jgi:hypothetical protein
MLLSRFSRPYRRPHEVFVGNSAWKVAAIGPREWLHSPKRVPCFGSIDGSAHAGRVIAVVLRDADTEEQVKVGLVGAPRETGHLLLTIRQPSIHRLVCQHVCERLQGRTEVMHYVADDCADFGGHVPVYSQPVGDLIWVVPGSGVKVYGSLSRNSAASAPRVATWVWARRIFAHHAAFGFVIQRSQTGPTSFTVLNHGSPSVRSQPIPGQL